MEILPIITPLLKPGDDLAHILMERGGIAEGDIVVISSKAVATTEGAAIDLSSVVAEKEAMDLRKKYDKTAQYYQAIINETKRMNGQFIQTVDGIVLTELRPDGMTHGSILVPNAGLDRSNIDDGYVIGWPQDPVASGEKLQQQFAIPRTAVIITDSGLCPRRRGVMAFALTVCGIDPLQSMVGTPDLFGQELGVTEEAIADQLATAANFMMGNGDQSCPAAIIRGHNLTFTDFSGWVPGIEREKDIYYGVI
ncbi:coenzyme F420-0:L-glutamate ligase [Candidatus Peregrinibacteria bacterium CG10_big_fil_rev_8_21_14_0_10_42_8]|nr:MAG: coenzyme F420-0:L-glutamate ligase [Candidatus Peregrinibacteria bacterium CG10_big_fil_rev_8_21_14_0_10_42_8]